MSTDGIANAELKICYNSPVAGTSYDSVIVGFLLVMPIQYTMKLNFPICYQLKF